MSLCQSEWIFFYIKIELGCSIVYSTLSILFVLAIFEIICDFTIKNISRSINGSLPRSVDTPSSAQYNTSNGSQSNSLQRSTKRNESNTALNNLANDGKNNLRNRLSLFIFLTSYFRSMAENFIMYWDAFKCSSEN